MGIRISYRMARFFHVYEYTRHRVLLSITPALRALRHFDPSLMAILAAMSYFYVAFKKYANWCGSLYPRYHTRGLLALVFQGRDYTFASPVFSLPCTYAFLYTQILSLDNSPFGLILRALLTFVKPMSTHIGTQ
jgi:hypothetical protein